MIPSVPSNLQAKEVVENRHRAVVMSKNNFINNPRKRCYKENANDNHKRCKTIFFIYRQIIDVALGLNNEESNHHHLLTVHL